MKVTRYNYPAQFGNKLEELASELGRMLSNGQYVLSPQVDGFEADFSRYLSAKHCVGVNSGTDALVVALMALGLGPGDEVITQANTFHATVAAICLCGATPVLVDATEDSFQIDQRQVREVITPQSRAIVPVHLYGYPAQLETVQSLAETHQLAIVEDAAQAHGARSDGKRVGTIGQIGCFSFHPSKNLAAAGDGGAVVTDDDEVDRSVRQLRSLGQAAQNDHVRVGLNSKLDAFQAAVLRVKLAQLDGWNRQRQQAAALYRERLSGLEIGFQVGSNMVDNVYHLFQIQTDQRDALREHLVKHEIDAVIRYPVPIHLQPAFRSVPRASRTVSHCRTVGQGAVVFAAAPGHER